MLDWSEYGKLLVALWALINPLGAISIFLCLTEHYPAARQHIGSVAAVAVGVILIVFVFVGQAVLQVFGIHIPSFRITGVYCSCLWPLR
jgi:multiple antibiotic resistance protein